MENKYWMRLLMHSPWHNSRQETGGSSTDTQNKIRYKLDNKNFLRAAEDGTRIQQYHSSATLLRGPTSA